MADQQPRPVALFRRLLNRIGNPLEWSEVDKCLLVVGLNLGGATYWAVRTFEFVRHPQTVPFLNTTALKTVQPALVFWPIGFALLGLIALVLRRKRSQSPVLVHLTIQYYAVTNAVFAGAVGSLSIGAGMLLLGGMAIGTLLFGFLPALLAGITFLVILIIATVGAWAGWMPYAPLLQQAPFEPGGRLTTWWFAEIGGAALLFLVLVVGTLAYSFYRWRDREDRLAIAYRDLSEAKDRLVRAESLAAIGSLVTGAAHELRNPLGSSGGLLQSLRDDLLASAALSDEEKEEALETLDMARKGHERAATIAERLYSLTDDLETRGSVAELGDSLEALGQRFAPVRLEVSDELRGKQIPQSLFKVILPNLLENAAASGSAEPPLLRASVQQQELQFEVSDNGAGIAPEKQDEVFKPFVGTERAGAGHRVGLGLYIVHELVTRMGGSVSLESDVGKGTRVLVRVPLP